jgi:hypothetical protein
MAKCDTKQTFDKSIFKKMKSKILFYGRLDTCYGKINKIIICNINMKPARP